MSESSSSDSSSFAGWSINGVRVDPADRESVQDDDDFIFYKKFTLIQQNTGAEHIIQKGDSVMVSGSQVLPFVGIIEEIYTKKHAGVIDEAVDEDDDDDDEEEIDINSDVRVSVLWFYRKEDIDEIAVIDPKMSKPEMLQNELLFSTHENGIRAKYVMHKLKVYFVKDFNSFPSVFDISVSGKLSGRRMQGHYVRRGCSINEQGQVERFFQLDEANESLREEVEKQIVDQMCKTKKLQQDMNQQNITENFLKPIADGQESTGKRIIALAQYWKSITYPSAQFKQANFIEEIKQTVPTFNVEDVQSFIIGISNPDVLKNLDNEITAKLNILLCIFALKLILDAVPTKKSEKNPNPDSAEEQQKFELVSQIIEFIADQVTVKNIQSVNNVLQKFLTQTNWHNAVKNLLSKQIKKQFLVQSSIPLDKILKKFKLNKRLPEKGQQQQVQVVKKQLAVGKQQQQQKTGKKQFVQDTVLLSQVESTKDKNLQKQPKNQQKKPAAAKKGPLQKTAPQRIVESSDDDELDSGPPQSEQQTEVTSQQQQQQQQQQQYPESQQLTQTVVEQLSCTGGKYKCPTVPPQLQLFTMDQILNLQTDIVKGEQKLRNIEGLQNKSLLIKVSWVEDGRPEEGQYVLAYVAKKKQQFYLEFVYALDQNDCPKYLSREDFLRLWENKDWREQLSTDIREQNNIKKWLKSKGWVLDVLPPPQDE